MKAALPFKLNDIIETPKAVLISITETDTVFKLWLPKSQIINKHWKKQGIIEIPMWLYDKKIDELMKEL